MKDKSDVQKQRSDSTVPVHQESAAYSGADVLSLIDQAKIGGIFQARMTEGFPLLYANTCYYQLHGYTKEEFEKLFDNRAAQVVAPEDIDAVSAQIQKALAKKQKSIALEYRVRCKNGKYAWLHASAGFTQTDDGVLMSGMVLNIDKRKNFEQQLIWSEKRFQTAIAQAHINVWEYDLKSRSILQADHTARFFDGGKTIQNVPESQIEAEVVHPDDAQKYEGLYDALRRGDKNVSAVVRIRPGKGKYRWEKINYTNIFDETGAPVRAVAVSEDISAQKEAEQRYYQEEYLREMLSADMLLSAKIHFSQDKVLYIWSNHYKKEDLDKIDSYSQLLHKVSKLITNKSDKKRYLEQFAQESLTQAAFENKNSLYGEYRCTKPDGHIVWCAFRFAITEDPVTSERVGIFYVREIDERKKIELALRERAERDALTGLYNRQTLESMICHCIQQQRESESLCALFVVDMDEFKQINDRYGHYAGDCILQEVGRILREDADGRNIAGRLGGDEFLVFADNIADKQAAIDIAARICRQLNIRYVADGKALRISASVGLVAAPCKEADFKEMFQKADAALYDAKSNGKATYACYSQSAKPGHETYILRDGCIARQHLGERCMIDHVDDCVLIIDNATHDMLFMNAPAQKMFDVQEYQGKKCYEILQGFSHPCVFCQDHMPGEKSFKTWENRNARIHKQFLIRDKMVQWDGRPARLEIFTDLSCQEAYRKSRAKADQVLLECVSILLTSQTLETAVIGVIENLGEFYQADRAYYAKIQDMESESVLEKSRHISITADTAADCDHMERHELRRWLEGLYSAKVVLFDTLEQMRDSFPEKYAALQKRGVVSFGAAALIDEDGTMMGYIGIENPRSNLDNVTLLKSLAYFLHNEISKRNMRRQQIFLEEHDPVTGLFNWKSYTKAFSQIQPDAISSLGILLVDIHHLYLLNREYGTDFGDDLLQTLAGQLKESFPAYPAFRLSGDSFVVLCQDITYESFLSQMHQLYQKMDDIYPGSIAIGNAWADEDIDPDQLLHHAHNHLLLAKQKKQDAIAMDSRLRAIHLELLQTALREGRFQVYLQPLAHIASGKIKGAEALVRYRDDEHGVVHPSKFIPQLEAENNIHYIDFFMLNEVCAIMQSWKQRGLPVVPVSLNFSRFTLMEENVVGKINRIVDAYGVERSLLEIEITEGAGDIQRRVLVDVSQKIVDSGYRLYLDRFGAENSNISILSFLPLSGLKFDKSLINDLYANATTKLLVKNLVQVCTQMGIESIAKGVEEQEQLDALASAGCTYAQGYLFNKPVPVADFEHKYLEFPMRTGQA